VELKPGQALEVDDPGSTRRMGLPSSWVNEEGGERWLRIHN